ncbi:MAG: cytochrome C [Proteobacteria bacterium]|nr:MAG: cytochrome C [Pseudomonadota bacterium]
MRQHHQLKPYVIAIIIASLLPVAWAEDNNKSEPMALRKIMQEMSDNMQIMTDAIAREQWHQVVTTAPLVGDHQQPPFMEKTRILRFVGADASTFRSYDKKTQQAAQALQQAALDNDGQHVISAFAELQKSCLSCHQRFREPFVTHFYGPQ